MAKNNNESFKSKVKRVYGETKKKVSEANVDYKKIYYRAYTKGYEDCKNGNTPIFASLVGAFGYGDGFNAGVQAETSQKRYNRRKNLLNRG